MKRRGLSPNKFIRRISLLIFTLVLFGATFPAAAAWKVWVIGESAKVKPNGDLVNDEYMVANSNYKDTNYIWDSSNSKITIKAARNEFIAFQVIVYADGENLTDISLSFSDLVKNADIISSSANIEYFRELYMTLPTSSYMTNSKGPGEFPEPLIPSTAPLESAPYTLNNGRSLPLWVDVYVPNNTPPGTYDGTVTVTCSEYGPKVIDLELTVWNFTIPPQMNIRFWAHLYQNDIAKLHELGDSWVFTPQDIWPVEKEYFKMARKHRLELSPRDARAYIEFDVSGNITTLDWTQFDNTFGTALDGTLYDDGIGNALWQVQGFATKARISTKPVSQQKVLDELGAITTHYESKGWLKDKTIFTYYWDEPSISDYPEIEFIAKLQNIASDGKIAFFLTEQPTPLDPSQQQYNEQVEKDFGPDLLRRATAYEDEADPYYTNWTGQKDVKIDIYCPNSKFHYPSDPNIIETAAGARLTGTQVWNYQASEPWIGNQVVDADGLSFRTWPWAAWKYKSEGLFFWCANSWGVSTANYTDNTAVFTNADTYHISADIIFYGDGLIFYPGHEKGIDGPIASHRLKQIRRGMTDFEYIFMLSHLGGDTFINTQYSSTINFDRAYAFYAPPTTLTAAATASDTTIEVDSIAHVLKHADGYDGLKIIGDSPGEDEIIYVTSFVSMTTICNLKSPLKYSHSSGAVVAPMYAPYSFEPKLDYLFGSDGNGRGEWSRNIDNWDQARENIALEIISQLGGAQNDMTKPGAISVFTADAVSSAGGNVDLSWTASGDDGSSGTATSYEIRYDTTDPFAANWGYATKVASPPTPQAAGATENFTVTGLTPDTAYFFRIYAYDEAGNRSPLSQVAPLIIDTTAPFTSGWDPVKNDTDVVVTTNIVLHVKDIGDGVDVATIVMTVEGPTVSPTITGTTSDYKLTYTPPSDFSFNQVVNVTVDADDLASSPNSMTQDAYSFTCMADVPVVSGRNPAASATSVALDTNIYFEIDGTDPVDSATLSVTVEGAAAITGGVQQSGFTCTVVSDGGSGYNVTIDPDVDYSNSQVVDVVINCSNDSGTPMTQVAYSFTTAAAGGGGGGSSSGSSSSNKTAKFELCPTGMLLAAHPQELAIYAAFKQKYLAPYAWGQKFIDFYYQAFGPKAVAFLKEHKETQGFFRLVAIYFSKVISFIV